MSQKRGKPRCGPAGLLLLLAAAVACWQSRALPFVAPRWPQGTQRASALARPFFSQVEELPLKEAEEAPPPADTIVAADSSKVEISAFLQVPKEERLAAVVQGVKSFGVFLDVQLPGESGSVRGLLSSTGISAKHFPLAEHFEAGQEVSVQVIEVDVEKGQLQLVMVDLQDHSPFLEVPEDLWCTGYVRHVAAYGLHVDVEHPESGRLATGRVYVNDVSRDFVPEEELRRRFHEGQQVRVRVKGWEGEKMDLSMLAQEEEAEEGAEDGEVEMDLAAFRKMSAETPLVGKVVGIFPFGVKVRLAEPPGQGLVHISKMPASLMPVTEHFERGQEVSVQLWGVDEAKGLLQLGIKAKTEDAAAFPRDKWLRGFVSRVGHLGLSVEAEHPDSGGFAMGLVHISYVPGRMLPIAEHFSEGQEVSVRVISVEQGRLSLSMEEREEAQAFLEVPSDQWLTGIVQNEAPIGLHVLVEHPGSGKFGKALVRVSEMGQGDFQSGQSVAVRMKSVDVAKQQISLTMKKPVDYAALAKVPREGWHTGTVVKVIAGGALVEAHVAGYYVTGLLPHEEARTRRMKEGKTVQVRLDDVSPEQERVRFTCLGADGSSGGSLNDDVKPQDAERQDAEQQDAEQQDLSDDICNLLKSYNEVLREQGYDSVATMRQLSREEWQEMKVVCGLRPGHAARLRAALHPEWA